MYFRASVVSHNGTETYGFAVNNTTYKLYIKYKQPSVINNHDGTVTYVVNSDEYSQTAPVQVIIADYDQTGKLTKINVNDTLTGRGAYRITKNAPETKMFIWDTLTSCKPFANAKTIR